jgi:hypothetical protein
MLIQIMQMQTFTSSLIFFQNFCAYLSGTVSCLLSFCFFLRKIEIDFACISQVLCGPHFGSDTAKFHCSMHSFENRAPSIGNSYSITKLIALSSIDNSQKEKYVSVITTIISRRKFHWW